MSVQNYRNHRRTVLFYHGFTLLPIFALLAGSVVTLVYAARDTLYSASLLVLVALILLSLFVYVRKFPLLAQDRAIRGIY